MRAIDALELKRSISVSAVTEDGKHIFDIIDNQPTIEPERKKGYWVSQKGGGYCCSECGRYALDEVDGNFMHVAFKSNFCPYCGADMRGVAERRTDE